MRATGIARALGLVAFVLCLGGPLHNAQGFMGVRTWGLGAVLIAPTGLSMSAQLSSTRSIDAALGFGSGAIYLHGDYLWNFRRFFSIQRIPFDLYAGAGGRYFGKGYDSKATGDYMGLRAPVGVSYEWRGVPIEAFGELAGVLNFSPSTSFDVTVGLGARYLF